MMPRPVLGTAVSWNADASGNWSEPSNWNPFPPGPSDDVTIDRPMAAVTVTNYFSGNAVNRLTCSEDLALSGGTLLIGNSAQISGRLTVSAGTLTFDGLSTVTGPATLSGTSEVAAAMGGSGAVTFNALNWTGGTMFGSGTTAIPAAGTLSISGSDAKFLDSRKLNNSGFVAWSQGSIVSIIRAPIIKNLEGGTFDAQFDGSISITGTAAGTFNNAGLFKKSAGIGTTTVYWPFNNTGTVSVQAGTLELRGGGTSTGAFNVESGKVLSFSGGMHNLGGATFSNAGTIAFSGGTETFDAAATVPGTVTLGGTATISGTGTLTLANVTWTAGVMSGSGTTMIPADGSLSISDSGSSKYLNNGRTLGNSGTVAWSGGSISGSVSGATINNLTMGVFDAQFDGTISSSGTFNNAGLIKKSAGAGTTIVSWLFNNAGTVSVQAGTLELRGGGTSTGTFNVESGEVLSFNGGTHNLGGATFSNAGTIAFSGGTEVFGAATTVAGTVTLGGSATMSGTGVVSLAALNWTAGTMSGSGTTMIIDAGLLSMNGSLYLDGRTLSNRGTVAWSGGSIYTKNSHSPIINNLAEGVFDAQCDGTISNTGAAGTFNNAGLFKKSAGVGMASVFWPFNNTGTVCVQAGTLDLENGGMSTGTFCVDSGKVLSFSGGTHNLTGATFSNAGSVVFSGGTEIFNATTTLSGMFTLGGTATMSGTGAVNLANLNWTAGTMAGIAITTIVDAGMLTISGDIAMDARTLNNRGTMAWSGGTIYTKNSRSPTINNLAGGTFDARVDGTISKTGTAGTFNNSGLFKKSAGVGSTCVYWPFNNTGTVSVQAGTLELRGGGTSTGTFNVDSGMVLSFSGGTQNLAGATFDNSGTINFGDGTYNLGGATFSNVGEIAMNGGTETFASPMTLAATVTLGGTATLSGTGSLTFSSTLNWTGGTMSGTGTTTIPIGGTLSISGTAYAKSLDGRTISNRGTIAWSGGSISSKNNAPTINNLEGGVFNAQCDGTISKSGSVSGMFNNTGLFLKTASVGTTTIQWPFNNTGTIEVQSGTLSLQGGDLANSGTVFVYAGSNVVVNGNLTGGGNVTLDGAMTAGLSGSASVMLGADSLLTVNSSADATFSGAIAGAGAVTKTGTGAWILSGTNTYSGGTTVTDGLLDIRSDDALPDGDLVIGANGTVRLGSSLTKAVRIRRLTMILSDSNGELTMSAQSAPEPGTLTLLIAGAIALAGAGWRCRRREGAVRS